MEMAEDWNIHEIKLFSAFAVGVPGKRTFFLGIGEKNNWLRVWLEKEHLQALDLGIERLFFTLSEEKISFPDEAEAPDSPDDIPSGLPTAELDPIEITLSYNEGKIAVKLLVQRSGSQDVNPLEISFPVTIAQSKKLSRQAKNICAAGRPLCPVCGGPIDPSGHTCPKVN